jgi:hypothetical protein
MATAHHPPDRSIFERGRAVARAADDQHRIVEFVDTSETEGNLESAGRCFDESIAIRCHLGQGHWLAVALYDLGKLDVRRGDLHSARVHLLEALSLAHRIGNHRGVRRTLSAIGALAAAEGDNQRADPLQSVASAAIAQIRAAFPLRSQLRAAGEPAVPPRPTVTTCLLHARAVDPPHAPAELAEVLRLLACAIGPAVDLSANYSQRIITN